MRTALLYTIIHISGSLAIGGCGHSQERAPPRPTSFRVALLTPGPISDQAWNAGAYKGLQAIRDSLAALISHIQIKTPADIEENFRLYGAQGYDLVFGHGFEFQDAALRVGPDYPGTVFVTTSGSKVGPNVAPIVFGFEDASYLAGLIAGTLTRSNVVGAIGGTELPPVKSSYLAYEAGVRAANPNVRVLISYLGTWDDATAGKEQALAQIQRGADFIFQNADAAGLGVFQAAKQSKNVYVFGANSNQNDVAPTVVIASAVIDLPRAFLAVAREVKERRFEPRVIFLGRSSNVVRLEVNPALAHLITPALQARVDSTQQRIIAGTFHPPRLEFVDSTAAGR